MRRTGIKHRASYECHVPGGIVSELRWNDVRAEICRLRSDNRCDAQCASFVVHGESVAGFGFEGGRATAQEFVGEAVEVRTQLLIRRCARRFDGAANTSR